MRMTSVAGKESGRQSRFSFSRLPLSTISAAGADGSRETHASSVWFYFALRRQWALTTRTCWLPRRTKRRRLLIQIHIRQHKNTTTCNILTHVNMNTLTLCRFKPGNEKQDCVLSLKSKLAGSGKRERI